MRKSLTRAATGAAVAAAATVALAGTANAGVLPVRVHTTLSIVESKNVMRAGHTDVISGRLAAGREGLAGRFVFLDRVVDRKLVPVGVEVTGKAGWVSFAVRPHVTARYELVYRGARLLAPTHSGVVTIKVVR